MENIWFMLIEEPVENVPGSISEEKAVEIAKAAIAVKNTLKPNVKIAVRNTASQFIVTFGEPPPPAPAGFTRVGGGFDFRVYINRLTGEVNGIEVSA